MPASPHLKGAPRDSTVGTLSRCAKWEQARTMSAIGASITACALDSNDELLIHTQQALRRPRRHAVERMLIGVAVLGPRCFPTLLPAHLSRSLQSKGSRPELTALQAAPPRILPAAHLSGSSPRTRPRARCDVSPKDSLVARSTAARSPPMMICVQFASGRHFNSTNKNIHAVPLHIAIMLAVNSAADNISLSR
jgi:hypothetical protein